MNDDDFHGGFSDTDPEFTGGFFGWGDDGRERREELEDWAANLPDQFDPDKPIVEVEAPELAAVQAEYAAGGDPIYLDDDGRRCVDWGRVHVMPDEIKAAMIEEWEATGEVGDMIVLHTVRAAAKEGGVP